jgi:transcriptional regulator with XRE-family HTH domain
MGTVIDLHKAPTATPILSELCTDQGLTEQRLAELVGVDRGTVERWESGVERIPPGQRARLAGLFGVTVDYLMGWVTIASLMDGWEVS